MSCTIACIIPARYGSTRLRGKPLIDVGGKPLVVWVYERAVRSGAFDRVMIATDDGRILAAAKHHDAEAVMTSPSHRSGTDRVMEAAAAISCRYIVNLQGDEPLVPPELLRDFSRVLPRCDDNSLLTCVSDATMEEIRDPNVVKAVCTTDFRALYFSRAAIPYPAAGETGIRWYRHVGVYGFTPTALSRFCRYRPGMLERTERLEQLRALENGMTIQCLYRSFESFGIDTPEDIERWRAYVAHERMDVS